MVKSKEEILTALNTLIGDNDSAEYLALLEDITDTVDSVNTVDPNAKNWENEYKTLQTKYKERFFTAPSNNDNPTETPTDTIVEDSEPTEFDDLFVEKEN